MIRIKYIVDNLSIFFLAKENYVPGEWGLLQLKQEKNHLNAPKLMLPFFCHIKNIQ